MYTTNLRKVGGSIMLAVPPAILDMLHLEAGATVGMDVDAGRLIIAAAARPRYTMAELLASFDYEQPNSPEDRDWTDGSAVGRELL